ncbi:MAG: hypothetical protein IH985_07405 [Planctomycetes bacterium]|nr:hypothetical protein [Planctomycetota bacterium]
MTVGARGARRLRIGFFAMIVMPWCGGLCGGDFICPAFPARGLTTRFTVFPATFLGDFFAAFLVTLRAGFLATTFLRVGFRTTFLPAAALVDFFAAGRLLVARRAGVFFRALFLDADFLADDTPRAVFFREDAFVVLRVLLVFFANQDPVSPIPPSPSAPGPTRGGTVADPVDPVKAARNPRCRQGYTHHKPLL